MSDKYTHEKALEWLIPYEFYSGFLSKIMNKFSLLKVAQMYLSFAAWKITFLDISSQVLLKTDEMTYWYKSILYRIIYAIL